MVGTNNEDLELSTNSLKALQEFMQDREKLELQFKKLEEQKEFDFNVFKEDWQLSQFWYSEDFASKLGQLIINNSSPKSKVAMISCPTGYFHMKSSKFKAKYEYDLELKLLEFDKRFEKFSEFQFYDYNDPLNLPTELQHEFDLICVDPPFLSKECWEKFKVTIEYMKKPSSKVIACTGLVMTEFLKTELGLEKLDMEVTHSNGLSNEFGVFSNF